jgi:hypothetical protein
LPKNAKWLFIVGCENSGTTLLSEILAKHSDISALPDEGQYFTNEFPIDWKLGLSRMWTLRDDLFTLSREATSPDPYRVKKEWLFRLDQSKPCFLEKTPANIARMLWLDEHFQEAYFIGIVRNGYAVAEGIRRRAEPIHPRDGWPIELAARHWSQSNNIMLKNAESVERFLLIRYEDLVTDLEGCLDTAQNFLGLKCQQILDNSTLYKIHGETSRIVNMNKRSIDRLSEMDIRIISEISKNELLHFGYSLDK